MKTHGILLQKSDLYLKKLQTARLRYLPQTESVEHPTEWLRLLIKREKQDHPLGKCLQFYNKNKTVNNFFITFV